MMRNTIHYHIVRLLINTRIHCLTTDGNKAIPVSPNILNNNFQLTIIDRFPINKWITPKLVDTDYYVRNFILIILYRTLNHLGLSASDAFSPWTRILMSTNRMEKDPKTVLITPDFFPLLIIIMDICLSPFRSAAKCTAAETRCFIYKRTEPRDERITNEWLNWKLSI